MRLACPYCGERDFAEFTCFGEEPSGRPDPEHAKAGDLFVDYVYLRENRAGPNHELWYHGQGCRQWLRVHRDTRTHEILGVELAAPGVKNVD
jgi:methylglutamate dehydrogenase subunit B